VGCDYTPNSIILERPEAVYRPDGRFQTLKASALWALPAGIGAAGMSYVLQSNFRWFSRSSRIFPNVFERTRGPFERPKALPLVGGQTRLLKG